MSHQSVNRRLVLYLVLAAVAYVGLFAALYLADPLAQAPVLDARENLTWAQLIRADALPAEPLYRALLYPWVLSWFPAVGAALLAAVFGFALHVCSAVLVGLIAQRLWRYRPAAWLAGLLYAVYPVALYFAGQIFDITFATTLFLVGIYFLLRGDGMARRHHTFALLGGLLGGLTVLARPNFLPAVLCFPVVLLFMKPRAWKASALAAFGLAVVLASQGLVNVKLSGEFRMLPWQGAYNLYAANREGANGKYYMQRVVFDEVPAGANTTRLESEFLYRDAVGAGAPMHIDAMSSYWRARLLDDIAESPGRWLGLMLRKVVFVFNDWEQYNNLTYAYHKARWSLLTWNPLGWGVLLLAASAGLFFGFLEAWRPALYGIALLGLAYAGGLLLFFVSARFRLPLAPLLCLAAGGCAFWPRHTFLPGQRIGLLVGLAGVAILSFGHWFDARDRATFIQDELLLAKASSEVGDDVQALDLARAVLAREPDRAEAQRLEVTSLFNLWLGTGEPFYWIDLGERLPAVTSGDPAVAFIRGVYEWRSLRPEAAIRIWQAAVEAFGARAHSSLRALQATGVEAGDPDGGPSVEQMKRLLGL